jgi:hypothetical protein
MLECRAARLAAFVCTRQVVLGVKGRSSCVEAAIDRPIKILGAVQPDPDLHRLICERDATSSGFPFDPVVVSHLSYLYTHDADSRD